MKFTDGLGQFLKPHISHPAIAHSQARDATILISLNYRPSKCTILITQGIMNEHLHGEGPMPGELSGKQCVTFRVECVSGLQLRAVVSSRKLHINLLRCTLLLPVFCFTLFLQFFIQQHVKNPESFIGRITI
jgi:hypothetical protein